MHLSSRTLIGMSELVGRLMDRRPDRTPGVATAGSCRSHMPRGRKALGLNVGAPRRSARRWWTTSYRPQVPAAPVDRLRLGAARYAVNEEAATCVAVVRVFTDGSAGLLSDWSAAEVAERLDGLELDVDTVDARLT